jgi:lipopolysaccharide transport system permease protein
MTPASPSGPPRAAGLARTLEPFVSLWKHRELVFQLTRREVAGRYRGSMLGLLWSFVNPVLMLAVYTFVFSVVFKARWTEGGDQSQISFAVTLFAGLIVFNIFSECVNRAPQLIVSQPNYVKKVVFPLEILPWVSLLAALFHAAISLVILLTLLLLTKHNIHVSAIFLPLILLPLVLWTMGLGWFLSSLGVFLRDIGQIVGVATTALLFLTPIFFPVSALPPRLQVLSKLNPLALPVEQARAAIIFGRPLAWDALVVSLLVSLVALYLGYWWFQKTRRGFADVI